MDCQFPDGGAKATDTKSTTFMRRNAKVRCTFGNCGEDIPNIDISIKYHIKTSHADILDKQDMSTLIAELQNSRSYGSKSQSLSASFRVPAAAHDATLLNPNNRIKSPSRSTWPRCRSSSLRRRSKNPTPRVATDPDFARKPPVGGSLWSPCSSKPSARATEPHSETPSSADDSFKQPETRPISQDQLVAEVKGIYAGLVMVESKCIEVDSSQSQSQESDTKLDNKKWQALIALHRTLLHEHHDFFLASQRPSASRALKNLATKYAMPARMWRHGIHSFLELLRHRLPASLEHMLSFIYLAYSMMALLHETTPAFEDAWIECLGDLSRYRIAIEDDDTRDREIWTSVSRNWYSKASDKSPTTGRLYHHLAILARPNALQQLFYYAKSLFVPLPFGSARESILTLFDPLLDSKRQRRQERYLKPTSQDKANPIWQYFAQNAAQNQNSCPSGHKAAEWRIDGSVNGVAINALADTGATSCSISREQAERFGVLPKLQSAGSRSQIRLPNGKLCTSIGTATLPFIFAGENKVHEVNCNIVENLQHGVIFGLDFLEKSQTLTEEKYYKERVRRITCAARSCFPLYLFDDEHAAAGRKARMEGFIHGHRAVVVPDTGSGIMAVSSSFAEQLGLEIDATRNIEIQFADGSTSIASGIIKAGWQFSGHNAESWDHEWHVIDGLPVDAILSEDFVTRHNVFFRHQTSFVQEFGELLGPELDEIFGIMPLPEGNHQLANLAEEFLTDLLSPAPFGHFMNVKEVARRRQIFDNISQLTPDAQTQERVKEEARRQAWDQMKEMNQNLGDWTTLRDRYINEIRQHQASQQAQMSATVHDSGAHSSAGNSNAAEGPRGGQKRSRKLWRGTRRQRQGQLDLSI